MLSPSAPAWKSPSPHVLLDWQRRQELFTRTNMNHAMLRTSLNNGSWNLRPEPIVPPTGLDPVDFAALVLMRTEAERLLSARTYSIGANTTGLAVATTAGSSPKEKISVQRPPSPCGLMVFADPIGSDAEIYGATDGTFVEIHTPIVAVSWSLWDGTQSEAAGATYPLIWFRQNPDGNPVPLPPELRGIWMTFYAPRTADQVGLDPEQTVAVGPDGSPITARQAAAVDRAFQQRTPELWGPLGWHNEIVLPEGGTFSETTRSGTVQRWAATVYTVWQIMQQTGRQQLVETRTAAVPPKARKKAEAKARQLGQPPVGDGVVRVVDLAAPAQPSKQAAANDAAASDGRRTVEWSCRWPVPPYRRSTCLNPHLHRKLGDDALRHHEHRDDVVPLTIKGPKDKPLRMRGGTTFTFDGPRES